MCGPFGIQKGVKTAYEECDWRLETGFGITEISKFIYQLDVVPKPHSAFPKVSVGLTPQNGIYFIRAWGEIFYNGIELKKEFKKIFEQLSKSYGNAKVVDSFIFDGIEKNCNDWMESLSKNESDYYAIWRNEYGHQLKNDLQKIMLGVVAEDSCKGYLCLVYEFDNYYAAVNEIDLLNADSL